MKTIKFLVNQAIEFTNFNIVEFYIEISEFNRLVNYCEQTNKQAKKKRTYDKKKMKNQRKTRKEERIQYTNTLQKINYDKNQP